MKAYEIVVHNFENKRYVKEVYSRESNGQLSLVEDSEADQIPMNYENRIVVELHHSLDYERVKSPFNGKLLYGRYINVSNRVSDSINRF